MGRHAPGPGSCSVICLLVDINHQAYHKTDLSIRLAYLSNLFFFFEIRCILVVLRFGFGFTRRPVSRLLSAERNKDASHAPTARKLTLDALHTINVAAFLFPGARFPKSVFENKTERGGEREEREKRRRRKGRDIHVVL
jgi:hypothetical protein